LKKAKGAYPSPTSFNYTHRKFERQKHVEKSGAAARSEKNAWHPLTGVNFSCVAENLQRMHQLIAIADAKVDFELGFLGQFM